MEFKCDDIVESKARCAYWAMVPVVLPSASCSRDTPPIQQLHLIPAVLPRCTFAQTSDSYSVLTAETAFCLNRYYVWVALDTLASAATLVVLCGETREPRLSSSDCTAIRHDTAIQLAAFFYPGNSVVLLQFISYIFLNVKRLFLLAQVYLSQPFANPLYIYQHRVIA